jgi:hypothetical protein
MTSRESRLAVSDTSSRCLKLDSVNSFSAMARVRLNFSMILAIDLLEMSKVVSLMHAW